MDAFIGGVNSRPFGTDEFLDLAEIAGAALEGRRREIPLDAERCIEDFPPGTLWLTDHPMNQLGFSIIRECKRRFPNDHEAISRSFLFRWFATQKALADGRVDEYTRGSGSEMEIHGSVFAAAAECPLVRGGGFDSTFESRVRKFDDRGDSQRRPTHTTTYPTSLIFLSANRCWIRPNIPTSPTQRLSTKMCTPLRR